MTLYLPLNQFKQNIETNVRKTFFIEFVHTFAESDHPDFGKSSIWILIANYCRFNLPQICAYD